MSSFVNDAPHAIAGTDPAASILSRWSLPELVAYLGTPEPDVVFWAARSLALVGDWESCEPLVARLDHPDADIIHEIEQALCSIWTRAASAEAIAALHRATRLLHAGDDAAAEHALAALLTREPGYAEAHHLLGIAQLALGRAECARESFRRTVRLNPYHYAAHGNLGHVAVERGRYREARRHYRRALEIHPHQPELRETLRLVEAAAARRVVA